MSEFKAMSHGVPQGSVLGPTLFLIFINDIANIPRHGKLSLYADDAVFFYEGASDSETARLINIDLAELSNYLHRKKLALNAKKTKVMHFHAYAKSLDGNTVIRANGVAIEIVQKLEYLGLTRDSHLSWSLHCAEVCKKLRRVAGILYKVKSILPTESLLSLYFAFGHCHLKNMVKIWGHAPAAYLKPVQVLQNRCMKTIFGLDWLTSSVELYTLHAKNILPIKGLQLLSALKYVCQVRNNELHHTVTLGKCNGVYVTHRIH